MKIHYCWFGHNPKPPLISQCILSWRRFCPNAEVIEWNESNFDINMCRYTAEAYQAKKWAFVSDYCRFYVLYNFGGIYLDTDVELIRSLDNLPNNFVGFEDEHYVNSGLIRAAPKGDFLCKAMLEDYNNDVFLYSNNAYNQKTVCQRETFMLSKLGLRYDCHVQNIKGITIFPREYFCPLNYRTGELNLTPNTYSIHHYAASWCEDQVQYSLKIRKQLMLIFPPKFATYFSTLITNIKFRGLSATLIKILKLIIRDLPFEK